MVLRPVPRTFNTFNTFNTFATFNPALNYLIRVCPQSPRTRSVSDRALSMSHPPSPVPDGESPWTATVLLHAHLHGHTAVDGAGRRSVSDGAGTWLREVPAAGPRSEVEPREDALQGIGEKALSAARWAEGVILSKERIPQGRWFWMLPPSAADRGEDGTPLSP